MKCMKCWPTSGALNCIVFAMKSFVYENSFFIFDKKHTNEDEL